MVELCIGPEDKSSGDSSSVDQSCAKAQLRALALDGGGTKVVCDQIRLPRPPLIGKAFNPSIEAE